MPPHFWTFLKSPPPHFGFRGAIVPPHWPPTLWQAVGGGGGAQCAQSGKNYKMWEFGLKLLIKTSKGSAIKF